MPVRTRARNFDRKLTPVNPDYSIASLYSEIDFNVILYTRLAATDRSGAVTSLSLPEFVMHLQYSYINHLQNINYVSGCCCDHPEMHINTENEARLDGTGNDNNNNNNNNNNNIS